MLARTALGECGSAQPGPSATQEAPNASAERSTVPTLPGSPTRCRYTHSGPDRRAPALLVDGDHARAGAERGHARERGALDFVEVVVAEVRAGQPVALERRRVRRASAAAIRSSPSARNMPLRGAPALGVQAAHGLQAGVVGMRSGHVVGCVDAVRSCNKKGAVLFRSDAREAVCRLPGPRRSGVRQPTPRGRPRQNVGMCLRRARRCRRAPCGRARRRPA